MGLVNTFTAIGFSETSPVIHLNKHISGSQKLQKYLTYEAYFFLKQWKFNSDSKNAKKLPQKIDDFLDNLAEFGNGKFSLLIREYP